jgi:D-alanyl-D-alanine carboxypeptidase
MTYVSALTLALVQEGKLTLDNKVAEWLNHESWFARVPNTNDLTVRMLLDHTSGIPDYASSPAYQEEFKRRWARNALGPEPEFTPREQVAFILDQEPLTAPGERFQFAATNVLLLGLLIEQAAAATFEQELQRRFLQPLALDRTVPARERKLANVVTGHLPADNSLGLPPESIQDGKLVLHPALDWAGGGIVSDVADLVRWAKVLYEGKALPGPYLADLVARTQGSEDTSSEWQAAEGSHYGLGVYVQHTGDLGTIYSHDGISPGYTTMVAYCAKFQLAIAVQVNQERDLEIVDCLTRLARFILNNTIK